MSIRRVSPRERCPICGRDSYCYITHQGTALWCTRVGEGCATKGDGTPIKSKDGLAYLHRLADAPFAAVSAVSETRAEPPSSMGLVSSVARLRLSTPDGNLGVLAQSLGVSLPSVERLGAFWHPPGGGLAPGRTCGWGFPMTGRDGSICGVCTRRQDGRKFVGTNHRLGLFVPTALRTDGSMLICEGASDCAAALTLGFDAIAIPAARSCLADAARFARGRDVVIVADMDRHGEGLRSALLLAKRCQLRCPSVRILKPPSPLKDLRAWLRDGCLTRDELVQAIEQLPPLA